MIIEELKDSIEKYFKELTENIQIFKEEGKNEKWTKIEIRGHLVDSAINNLQRIIRSSYEETPYYAEYDQDKWVDIQQYRKANRKHY